MLLRELFENLIVNEVSMAPKNLKKLAANINAYCGIEFELYYPGMKPSEDDEDAVCVCATTIALAEPPMPPTA